MTRRSARRSFVSGIALAVALTLGASGAQAAAGGIDWWELGPTGGFASAMAFQTDGKIVVAGTTKTYDFMLAGYTMNGHRDTSFGSNGKVLTDFGATEVATAVAIQPDGEIVVAGYSNASGNNDFALARYTTSGTLDPTFGTGGKVLTDFGSSSEDTADALAIQPNGEIVVAGSSDAGGSPDFALARYTTSGTLDPSFGTVGKVLTNFGSASNDGVASVAIQPNGKIVVAGGHYAPKSHTFALARYTTSGTLDTSFGRGGKVLPSFGYLNGMNSSEATGVAIQRNGKIVAVGNTYGGTVFALARFTRRGHLDPRFGTRGRVVTSVGLFGQAGGTALAIQTDGKIVAAGSATISGAAFDCNGDRSSMALVRYTTRGRLDKSFGKGGKVTKHFGSRNSAYTCALEYAAAVAIQPDGKIVAAGGLYNHFMLARYLP